MAKYVSITEALECVKSGDYVAVKHDLLETVRLNLDKEGMPRPHGQLDVHVKQ
jgi:hypothetical protein